MTPDTSGLHHVTAIASDPTANAAFYVDTLGLRFVKRTVNHDDPGTYHFYFGDGEGTPGTNLTFFPWGEDGRDGEFGAGQTQTVAYLIPDDSVQYWTERLADADVAVERAERFGATVLGFDDPDGIRIELVADPDAEGTGTPWADGPVPVEHQLRGFYGVTLAVADVDATARVLEGVLGYEHEATAPDSAGTDSRGEGATSTSADRHRYRSAAGGPASIVDLVETDRSRGRMGAGTVHHVAFAAESVDEQEAYREAYADIGLNATEPIDREYFHAIYCREPGGVLFEIATTGPGFAVDESVDELGSRLTLPDRLEDQRERIESQLPAFELPESHD
ncbi:ring-cleaving dioxygenase [Halorubellus sp. JP-L1]|uniref:ring-cleaving dioxygenase n=1 Tax=Halorubellus sp. JP-L1 TaxID=2715753 RepID=UPI0014087B4B|nr:ring-cleaving dioxygenase [Halorubellus sp. JP-L1]